MILLLAKSARALGRVCREARTVRTPKAVDVVIDIDPSAVL